MTAQNKSEKLETILNRSGIKTRWVAVLGATAHVYTFKKYEDCLRDVMTAAGFAVVQIADGPSLNRLDGFRMIFRMEG